MEAAHLHTIVALLRAQTTDLPDVEVKSGAGGAPKSVRDTISAFSNGRGGTLVVGLDERTNFTLVEPFDAVRVRDALAETCASDLEPPVRADVDIVEFEGGAVVVAQVPEMNPRFKPCYVKARGEYNGSFIRGGDGDRRLTDFEVHLLHTNRGQPTDDRQPVVGAGPDDLDPEIVDLLLRRVRHRHRRAFSGLDDTTVLRRLNVLVPDSTGALVPSLAGLLALGTYPQQFFPQLNVTFVAYPGLSEADVPKGGPRFLDNRAFDGPIPYIVDEAVAALLRNTAMRSFVDGTGRRDVFEYPAEAVREVVVNALVHRDYSPYSIGTPVQIALYADRLTIGSPGGLFGAVTEDDLGNEGVSSTRNPVIVKLLQDVRLPESDRTVCENRASGIPAVLRELRAAGTAAPEFDHRINRFKVTFRKHGALPPQVTAWLDGLGVEGLTAAQRSALGQMYDGRPVSGRTLERMGLSQRRARMELADLVSRDLIVRIGRQRYAHYILDPSALPRTGAPATDARTSRPDREAAILAALAGGRDLSRRHLEQATGLRWLTVLRELDTLIADGRVEATSPPRSPHRRYRLTRPAG